MYYGVNYDLYTFCYSILLLVNCTSHLPVHVSYLPPPGGEKSPWTNASHWRQKQISDKQTNFSASRLLTAPASTSWATHVLFVATPMNWEYMCTVCDHSYELGVQFTPPM